MAEVVALWWAAAAALQLALAVPITVRADNQAALWGCAGSYGMPDRPTCTAAQCFHLALGIRCPAAVSYQHVVGHCGDTPNELADTLAKLGAKGSSCLLPFRLDGKHWLSDAAGPARWLPHFCLRADRPKQLPSVRQNVMSWSLGAPGPRLSAEQIMQPFTRPLARFGAVGVAKEQRLTLTCITFNALSLLPPDHAKGGTDQGGEAGLHGATGRVSLLNDSLLDASASVVGVQEARTPAGQAVTKDFVRYCSGCTARRSLGVELWVRSGDRFPSHKVAVLAMEPTRLLARLDLGCLRLMVLVGHAPHRGHTVEERLKWWQATAELCAGFKDEREWLLLLDGNCRVGSDTSECIGDCHPDPQDEAGAAMHQLFLHLQVWAPSTFHDCMVGAGGTLMQKQSRCLQRSDYVAVPQSWRGWHIEARTNARISAGHRVLDHLALQVGL